MRRQINVTKTFMPPIGEYDAYLRQIWKNGQLTNQGPLLQHFESEAQKFLSVRHFHFVSNGTVALQLALRALNILNGEVITTPFSYVATVSSILWERCEPVFVDIEPTTFAIDVSKIEAAITSRTRAIMAVHVFGNPCDVKHIEMIAKKHKLKVIYDAAHAFGVTYNGRSLLSFGDITTCSFHATKVFHTIEGGCVITKEANISRQIELMKRFGHHGDDHLTLGINAKATEFQAAMGLCNLKYVNQVIDSRRHVSEIYDEFFRGKFQTLSLRPGTAYNYAYYPIVFTNESALLNALSRLASKNIFARRYFYPSLNRLPYVARTQPCPHSEDIASRIACLPLYPSLNDQDTRLIARTIVGSKRQAVGL